MVVTALVVLIASTSVQTARFAVYHDELWNHPAAVSLLEGKSWRTAYEVPVLGVPLPLVSGPYQGSLKTFLLVPLLATFGTSPTALRGIHFGLGMLYLAALYWALRSVLPRSAAALVFFLPLADPNLTMFVPTDQGPFLLQNIFFAVSLGALVRLVRQRELRWLLVSLAAASLALADKLTGAPLAAVLAILALAVGVPLLRRRAAHVLLAGLALALPLLPHATYFVATGLGELEANVGSGMTGTPPYPARLGMVLSRLMGYVSAGSAIPKSLTGQPPPFHRPLLPPLALALAGLGGVAALRRREHAAEVRVASLALLLGLATLAAIPGLDRPWHYLQLHPPLVIAAFLGFGALTRLPARRDRLVIVLRAIAGSLVVGAAVVGAVRTFDLMGFLAERQGVHMYSPGLYQLHRRLQALAPQRVICLNYSLCNPLYVLARGRVEVVDLTWAELSEGTEEYVRHLLSHPGTVVAFRQVSGAAGPKQAEYFAWLNRTAAWLLPRLEKSEVSCEWVFADGTVEFGLLRPMPTP